MTAVSFCFLTQCRLLYGTTLMPVDIYNPSSTCTCSSVQAGRWLKVTNQFWSPLVLLVTTAPKLLIGRKVCELTKLLTPFLTHTLVYSRKWPLLHCKTFDNPPVSSCQPFFRCVLFSNTSPFPNRLQRSTLQGQCHRSLDRSVVTAVCFVSKQSLFIDLLRLWE